jgi:hypothetical protein
MPLFYPSFSALRLADQIFEEVGKRTNGYEGRVGAVWYWRLPAGILAAAWMDNSVTEERWDVIRAQASTPRAGIFSTADFPFAAYGTSPASPPFIHDLQGEAEWSNRLYFQMGYMIEDMTHWLGILHTIAISPQISTPAALPALSMLERKLVKYAVDELDGHFTVTALHKAFRGQVSRSRLNALAQAWEANELLTQPPRRITYALRVLAEGSDQTAPQKEKGQASG